MLKFVLFVALLAAFAILLMRKVGFVEWMQVHAPAPIDELFRCTFCTSWWLCLLLCCIPAWLGFGLLQCVAIAMMATPITRYLVDR